MSVIIPACIPTSAKVLTETLSELSFASRIQIDVVDGILAHPASWPYRPTGDPRLLTAALAPYTVMVDLMVSDVVAAAEAWLEAHAKEIVIHLESNVSWRTIQALRHQYDFTLWLAGDDERPVEDYLPYRDDIDGVQLMGIDVIGQQGQPFTERAITNTRAVREQFPDLPILIDGAVGFQTLPRLKEAGATEFVVGSTIMQSADKAATYRALLELAQS